MRWPFWPRYSLLSEFFTRNEGGAANAASRQPRAASNSEPITSGRSGFPQQKLSSTAIRSGSAPTATALRTASSSALTAIR